MSKPLRNVGLAWRWNESGTDSPRKPRRDSWVSGSGQGNWQMKVEQLPPNNPNAERAVLGCMLRANSAIPTVIGILEHAGCFHADHHQKLFAVLRDLWEQGQPADLTTVPELLYRRGQQKDVTYSYL